VKADGGHTMAEHIIDKTLGIGGLLTPDEVIDRQGTAAVSNHFCGTTPTDHKEIVICGIPEIALWKNRQDPAARRVRSDQ
jgi:hypothetical protein